MKAIHLLTALTLAACAAPLPVGTTTRLSVSGEPPAPLPLGAGDVLQVVVHGRPEFSPEVGMRITAAGSPRRPLAGRRVTHATAAAVRRRTHHSRARCRG